MFHARCIETMYPEDICTMYMGTLMITEVTSCKYLLFRKFTAQCACTENVPQDTNSAVKNAYARNAMRCPAVKTNTTTTRAVSASVKKTM